MNGQPTAQNTRETGADGDLPGFRNWDNNDHVARAGRAVERRRDDDPALGAADARDADLPLRRAGLDRAAVDHRRTNPAVSLPELARIRAILAREELFVVVQDLFLTETAELADVVLPAATWGEKTGTFTNADRTVHLSEQAVDPPGEARADLDIFLDYARRMDFRDRDGAPLDHVARRRVGVRGLEGVLARAPVRLQRHHLRASCAAAAASNGRAPTRRPDGTERLYTDGRFNTDPDYAETLRPGPGDRARRIDETEYRAKEPRRPRVPAGRRVRAARPRRPTTSYPLLLTTGRTLYHFHTRTKTGARSAAAGGRAGRVGRAERRATPARSARRGRPRRVESPRGACRRRRASADIRAASCSCRSTTATGTATTTHGHAPRGRQRADAHRAGIPVSKQPHVQGRAPCASASSGTATELRRPHRRSRHRRPPAED